MIQSGYNRRIEIGEDQENQECTLLPFHICEFYKFYLFRLRVFDVMKMMELFLLLFFGGEKEHYCNSVLIIVRKLHFLSFNIIIYSAASTNVYYVPVKSVFFCAIEILYRIVHSNLFRDRKKFFSLFFVKVKHTWEFNFAWFRIIFRRIVWWKIRWGW